MISPHQLGMAMGEGATKIERQHQDQPDSHEATIRNGLDWAILSADLGAMTASVKKTMLEGPILSQVVPSIVFDFPTVVAEAADLNG